MEKLAEVEAITKEAREKSIEVAAENRVLIATIRAMQDECSEAKASHFLICKLLLADCHPHPQHLKINQKAR